MDGVRGAQRGVGIGRIEAGAWTFRVRAVGRIEQAVVQQDVAVAAVGQGAAGQDRGQRRRVPYALRYPADRDLGWAAVQVLPIEPEGLIELPHVEGRREEGHHVLCVGAANEGEEL